MLGVQGSGGRMRSAVLPGCDLCRGISRIIACPNCEPHLYVLTEAQAERLHLVASRYRPIGHDAGVDE